ncbi:hypothetical protein ABH944_002981 [Caballeronia udeis]|uniref:AP2/ERF domain-containing protein n=1 Tax=Caballeronia udeis TaxID=1232866 RepID=A0ABW8MLI1_9BURK
MKEIPLTQGKVAIVDDEDYEHLSQFKWYAMRDKRLFFDDAWYAYRSLKNPVTGRFQSVQMQREIMRPGSGDVVRFLNLDGLDNRRPNLVVTTRAKVNRDLRTPSRDLPRGVKRAHQKNRVVATMSVGNRVVHLGTFDAPEDASQAYLDAVKELAGYGSPPA